MIHATPPPQVPDAPYPQQYTECVVTASAYYRVPPELIATILMVEGGRVGHTSANTNGTYDMGPMQINTIHVPMFRDMGVPKTALVNNACVNIVAGTYLLNGHLKDSPKRPWLAVGNYHSHTPKYRNRYLRTFRKRYMRLLTQFGDYVRYIRKASYQRANALWHDAATHVGR